MKAKTKTTKKAVEEVEAVTAPPVKHTRVIRAVTPYTEEMMAELESRIDALTKEGFDIVSCVPYGVDHMVILLHRVRDDE